MHIVFVDEQLIDAFQQTRNPRPKCRLLRNLEQLRGRGFVAAVITPSHHASYPPLPHLRPVLVSFIFTTMRWSLEPSWTVFFFLSGYLLSGHESITERSRLFLQKYKNTTLTRQIYINNTERSKEYVNAKIKKTQKNINQTKKVQTSLRSVIKNI